MGEITAISGKTQSKTLEPKVSKNESEVEEPEETLQVRLPSAQELKAILLRAEERERVLLHSSNRVARSRETFATLASRLETALTADGVAFKFTHKRSIMGEFTTAARFFPDPLVGFQIHPAPGFIKISCYNDQIAQIIAPALRELKHKFSNYEIEVSDESSGDNKVKLKSKNKEEQVSPSSVLSPLSFKGLRDIFS